MSRNKWILSGAVSGLLLIGGLVALFIYPFVAVYYSVARSEKEIRKMEAKLQMPEVYEPVAKRLALYCQSDLGFFPQSLSGAWFPGELQKVGEGDGEVRKDHASIEMGGGFHHFGYRLEFDESTSAAAADAWQLMSSAMAQTNTWKLFLYSEGSDRKLLTSLGLPASKHLTKEELQNLVEAGYDRLIGDYPGAYGGKVMMLLRFGKTNEAAGACREWIKLRPDSWRPRFTLAHLRCRFGETAAASVEFTEWVNAHNNFAHCIFLALFNYREGATNDALKAVRLALDQPFVEPAGTSGNKFYLGSNGAMMAYLAGDYDLCLAVCDKMLADRRDGKAWKQKVRRLRAATMRMKGNESATLDAARHADVVKGDESWDWFTPYDTDEAGWHGSGDIPTPYPKSWTADQIRHSQ